MMKIMIKLPLHPILVMTIGAENITMKIILMINVIITSPRKPAYHCPNWIINISILRWFVKDANNNDANFNDANNIDANDNDANDENNDNITSPPHPCHYYHRWKYYNENNTNDKCDYYLSSAACLTLSDLNNRYFNIALRCCAWKLKRCK